jgi:hypothetical protein
MAGYGLTNKGTQTMTTLTKSQSVDLIEIVGSNIQVRTATIIKEDDVELSRSFHRHVLQPGDDLTEQDPKVAAIANAVWGL